MVTTTPKRKRGIKGTNAKKTNPLSSVDERRLSISKRVKRSLAGGGGEGGVGNNRKDLSIKIYIILWKKGRPPMGK